MTRKYNTGRFSSGFSSLWTFLVANRRRRPAVSRPRFRPLRIESCEDRNLLSGVSLASIKGTVYDDLKGDGLTSDDPPAAETVLIELFRDGGDGVFNKVDDTLVGIEASFPGTGAYAFDNLIPSVYFLREQVPAGSVQTIGPAYYTFEVAGSYVYDGTEFVVDTFDDPDPPRHYFIDAFHPDPTLIKTEGGGILGGQRDLWVDVAGTSHAISAAGVIGFDGTSGQFRFASAGPGTQAVLQYDGLDADIHYDAGPPPVDAALVNAMGLPSIDLTDGGVNTGLRIDFDTLQVGGVLNELQLQVAATNSAGDTVRFSDAVPEEFGPSSFFIPFDHFKPAGFSFTDVTSLEFTLNQTAIADVDFAIEGITGTRRTDTFDFGNLKLSSLSGYVYVDRNNDGIKDPGEAPIPNTTVTLIGIDTVGRPIHQQTTTDAAGFYIFADLWPGIYTIRETQPAAYLDGKDTIGTPGGVTSNDQFSAINLSAGVHGKNNNFGELRKTPPKLILVYPWDNWEVNFDGRGETPPAGSLALEGTPNDDVFEFIASARSEDWVLKINGVTREIGPGIGAVHFDGLGGHDTVLLTGTDGDDTWAVGPRFAVFAGDTYAVAATNVELVTVDGLGGNDVGTWVETVAQVLDRHVFYNNSAFDESNPNPNAADDHAIATDKTALRRGEIATLANYTSYVLGINGVMVDLADATGTITADDFLFHVGNSDDPSTWTKAPNPVAVTLREGAGTGGSDRVTIVWADRAIKNQWLEVTVLAGNTGLPADDVFYFGNAVGESGNSTTDAQVTITDLLLPRNNPRGSANPAGINFPYDYNRDQRVDVVDLLLALDNQTNFLSALKLIDLPGAESEGAGMEVLMLPASAEQDPTPPAASQDPSSIEMSWIAEFEQSSAQSDSPDERDPIARAFDALLSTYWS